MDFSVISVVRDLSETEREIAIEGGPSFVEAPDDYAVLLAQTGWLLRECTDVTAEFARLARAMVNGMIERTEALSEALGRAEFEERLERRRRELAAIDRSVLKRERFLAVAT
jgi:hypothetical protein